MGACVLLQTSALGGPRHRTTDRIPG